MPPKKRDRDSEGSRNGRLEHLQTDHDLFLHAFEKPTQIYRYLRTRNLICPVFIHRNLTYLKNRSTRSNKPRSTFKVDSLLGIKMQKSRNDNITWLGDYLNLMFLGFFDKTISEFDVVEVETFLMKISQKKRKDSLKALQKHLGKSVVKINPDDTTCPNKIPAISVSIENFKPIGGSLGRSCILQLNVTMLPSYSSVADDEPSAKRIKTYVTYESELVVFDKHNRCLLKEGEYEISLQERYPTTKMYSPKKHATWNDLPKSSIDSTDKNVTISPLMELQNCPTLKFRLVWTKEQIADLVDRPLPITVKKEDNLSNKENQPDQNHNNGLSSTQQSLSTTTTPNNLAATTTETSDEQQSSTIIANEINGDDNDYKMIVQQQLHQQQNSNNNIDTSIGQQQMQVVYQFIYNNNSLQQTEACDNYNCPWCTLNCICLYSLLKHLKLCHDRFNFKYVQIQNGARIDVTINELYDGSYTGSPHDLVGPSSAFSRTGPKRRPIVTSILVCRPKRTKPNLSEFLEIDENELNSQRPYITGHNRLYYHTMSCLPLYPKELDIDSEDENDTAWLERKTTMMIDEFTDVNEGEKELMKMWNLHTIKNGYVGDIQIPLACEMFVKMRGRELMEKKLYKNFVMHMCNLCDYGLVSPEVQYKTIQKLQREWNSYENGPSILIQSNEKQVKYWNEFGHLRHQQNELMKHQLKLQQQQNDLLDENNDVTDDNRQSIKNKKDNEASSSSSSSLAIPKRNDLKDGKLCLATVPLIKISTKISGNGNGGGSIHNSTLPSTSSRNLSMDDDSIASSLSRRKSLNQLKEKSGTSSNVSSSNSNNGDKKKSFIRDIPRRRMSNAALQPSTSSTTSQTKNAPKKISSRRNSLAASVILNSRKRQSTTKADKP